jgi:hypothetical protein
VVPAEYVPLSCPKAPPLFFVPKVVPVLEEHVEFEHVPVQVFLQEPVHEAFEHVAGVEQAAIHELVQLLPHD